MATALAGNSRRRHHPTQIDGRLRPPACHAQNRPHPALLSPGRPLRLVFRMAELQTPLSDRFDAALQLAHRVHRRQARKGTEIPYVAHVMAVCALVLEYGGT